VTYDVTALLDQLFDDTAVMVCTASPRIRSRLSLGPEDLPMDWRIEWEERAAIMEYDGGLPRDRAERAALEDIFRLMREAEK